MKWIDGLTSDEKDRRKQNWHRCYAWFPTCIGETPDHHKIYVWLVPLERRGTLHIGYEDCYWEYTYREIESCPSSPATSITS